MVFFCDSACVRSRRAAEANRLGDFDMRTVKYRVTGTRQPNVTAEGTVKELISWVGYVLVGIHPTS